MTQSWGSFYFKSNSLLKTVFFFFFSAVPPGKASCVKVTMVPIFPVPSSHPDRPGPEAVRPGTRLLRAVAARETEVLIRYFKFRTSFRPYSRSNAGFIYGPENSNSSNNNSHNNPRGNEPLCYS